MPANRAFLQGLGLSAAARRKQEDERYRRNLQSAPPNSHVQSESKMLDAQNEAERQVLLSRRNRLKPRIERREED